MFQRLSGICTSAGQISFLQPDGSCVVHVSPYHGDEIHYHLEFLKIKIAADPSYNDTEVNAGQPWICLSGQILLPWNVVSCYSLKRIIPLVAPR